MRLAKQKKDNEDMITTALHKREPAVNGSDSFVSTCPDDEIAVVIDGDRASDGGARSGDESASFDRGDGASASGPKTKPFDRLSVHLIGPQCCIPSANCVLDVHRPPATASGPAASAKACEPADGSVASTPSRRKAGKKKPKTAR